MINLKIKVPSVAVTYDKKHTKQVMRAAATEVANVARRLIRTGQASGRTYGSHTASAPGAPPASQTGKLAASIRTNVKEQRNTIVARITDVEFYAKFLETGATGGGGRKGNRNKRGKPSTQRVLAARPFLSAALDSRRASIADRIKDAIDKDVAFVKVKP